MMPPPLHLSDIRCKCCHDNQRMNGQMKMLVSTVELYNSRLNEKLL